jgi:hypothetical protein
MESMIVFPLMMYALCAFALLILSQFSAMTIISRDMQLPLRH